MSSPPPLPLQQAVALISRLTDESASTIDQKAAAPSSLARLARHQTQTLTTLALSLSPHYVCGAILISPRPYRVTSIFGIRIRRSINMKRASALFSSFFIVSTGINFFVSVLSVLFVAPRRHHSSPPSSRACDKNKLLLFLQILLP